VQHPDVALQSVQKTRYYTPKVYLTVLHHICSTKNSFDLRCKSVTFTINASNCLALKVDSNMCCSLRITKPIKQTLEPNLRVNNMKQKRAKGGKKSPGFKPQVTQCHMITYRLYRHIYTYCYLFNGLTHFQKLQICISTSTKDETDVTLMLFHNYNCILFVSVD